MRSDLYQYALIFFGAVAAAFFGVFVYREVFPEYKVYQNDYVALEQFRASYTGESPPAFKEEVKQIVLEREDRGPPVIDRCTSCHVALEIPYFSPTKIGHDINGKILRDANGNPVQVPNEDYIWGKLDSKIAELTDARVNDNLRSQGDSGEVSRRLKQSEQLAALKTATVDGYTYDVTKALRMHPLIGKETRPFEYHSVQEYGCTSCHNGNGRGLTVETAHGPVFDGHYEIEFLKKPQFTEPDPSNDPIFARQFNDKPGSSLIFQTTPIFTGELIQSKCVQCHQPSHEALLDSLDAASEVTKQRESRANAIKAAFDNDQQALITLLLIRNQILDKGLGETLQDLRKSSQNYALPSDKLSQISAQLNFLNTAAGIENTPNIDSKDQQRVLMAIDKQLVLILGSTDLVTKFEESTHAVPKGQKEQLAVTLSKFLKEQQENPKATGTIFLAAAAWNAEQEMMRHVKDTETSLQKSVSDQQFLSAVVTDMDILTRNYRHGEQLFVSQACYACHRITGFSRGRVGPELTKIGNSPPWYIKEHVVWPQGGLPTSTMPNFRFDHEELSDIMTFLLGQKGENKTNADTSYKNAVVEWEASKRKLPWEKPITPTQIHDLRYSMTVFATEGCASCHRLKGYESNVGFRIEKENAKPDFNSLYAERDWFSQMFPESIVGSEIVNAIEKNQDEIDQRIVDGVRQNSILEELDKNNPDSIEALYTPFKYAKRAKNSYYSKLIGETSDPQKKRELQQEHKAWQQRVHRVLMMFVQEYGLGRLICPRPNWSGVYRSDEWLMEHFKNPSTHVPRSIMPVFPFDDSKFFALTYMLDSLGIRNRNEVRTLWENRGFDPEQAVQIHCAQCHGEFLKGNGPVSEWIYPIPKNLRNADFLRNLTKERVIQSITHGVKGTPMPPWGEVGTDKPMADGIPVLTKNEIEQLANWLFSSLLGGEVIKSSKDVLKWQYTPEDVLQELQREGNWKNLKSSPLPEKKQIAPGEQERSNKESREVANTSELSTLNRFTTPSGEPYYASLVPQVLTSSTKANEDIKIADIFDVRPTPVPGPDKYGYYIKKRYYTEENIDAGRQFFEVNCAACHGKEADGAGERAVVMQEAKPRMLTNLDWIDTRDDLRLMRSIKFGVPGTGMTPWGDFTSALQRIQLVIYIRSLSQEKQLRDKLSTALYQAFDKAQWNIEDARINEYTTLEKIERQLEQLQKQESLLYNKIGQGEDSPEKAVVIYQQKLALASQLKQRKEIDQLFLDLEAQVKRENALYQEIGQQLLARKVDDQTFDAFLKLIAINDGRFAVQNNQLSLNYNSDQEAQMTAFGKDLITTFETKITELNKGKALIEGQMPSANRAKALASINGEINSLIQMKTTVISNLEEAVRSRQKQVELFNELLDKLKNNK